MKTTRSVLIKAGIAKAAEERAKAEGVSLSLYVEQAIKRHLASYKTVNIKVVKQRNLKY